MDVKSAMFDAPTFVAMCSALYGTIEEQFPEAQSVGGMELGSVPLSSGMTIVSLIFGYNQPLGHFVIRKEKRSHGMGNQIEGLENVEGKKVVIVDDVLTTGGSIVKVYDILKDQCDVLGAVVAVDRLDCDKTKLPLKVASLYTRDDLLI